MFEVDRWVGHTLSVSSDWVNSVAICEGLQRVVSGGNDRTVSVWSLADGIWSSDPLHGHKESVWCVSISPDGKGIASGSVEQTVRVWQLTGNTWVPTVLRGHSDWVHSIAISGRRAVSGSSDGTIRVWDIASGKPRSTVMTRPGIPVVDIFLSADGRTIRAKDSHWNGYCFVEKGGSWEQQATNDVPSDWFGWLAKDDWPHRLSMMHGEWYGLWKAAGGFHFTSSRREPYFGYLLPGNENMSV